MMSKERPPVISCFVGGALSMPVHLYTVLHTYSRRGVFASACSGCYPVAGVGYAVPSGGGIAIPSGSTYRLRLYNTKR